MMDGEFKPPDAVESVEDGGEAGKRRSHAALKPIILLSFLILVVLVISFLPEDASQHKTNETTTIFKPNLSSIAPIPIREGLTLSAVIPRQFPFRFLGEVVSINASELVFTKDKLNHSVYVAKGSLDGFRILVKSDSTKKSDLDDRAYTSPYTYEGEKVLLTFWWHNNSVIALNTTEDSAGFVRELLLLYPPTEDLI